MDEKHKMIQIHADVKDGLDSVIIDYITSEHKSHVSYSEAIARLITEHNEKKEL